MMVLSIITVCLNDASNLKKTLESIPSLDDVEIIVMDGESKDGSLDYLNSLTRSHFKFFSQSDTGIYDAMNKACAQSSGEYVYFLNAGDTLIEGALPEVVAELKTKKPDLLYGKVLCEEGGLGYEKGNQVEIGDFSWGMPISHQAIFYRKAALPIPAYDTRYRLIADYLLTRTLFESKAKTEFWNHLIAKFDLTGVSSRSHFKILKERSMAVKGRGGLSELVIIHFMLYPKYGLIALLRIIGIYEWIRNWRHS